MRGYIYRKKAMMGRTGINGYLCTAQGMGGVTLRNANRLVDFTLEAGSGTISTPTYNRLPSPINSSLTTRGITFSTDGNGVLHVTGGLEDYKNGNYGTETPMSYVYVGGDKLSLAQQFMPLERGRRYCWFMEQEGIPSTKTVGISVLLQKYNETTHAWENYKWQYPWSLTDYKYSCDRAYYDIPDDGEYRAATRVSVQKGTDGFGYPHNFKMTCMILKITKDGNIYTTEEGVYTQGNVAYKPWGHETSINTPSGKICSLYSRAPVTIGSSINYKSQAVTYQSGDVEKIVFPEIPLENGTYTAHPNANMVMHYFSDTEPNLGG